MFVISDSEWIKGVMLFYLSEMKIEAEIYDYNLYGETYLYWANIKPSDNLKVFDDGFVIGKTDFDDSHSLLPVRHMDKQIPEAVNPLLNIVVVKRNGEGYDVIPSELSIVYYSSHTVSDFTLPICLLEDLKPTRQGTGMMLANSSFIGNSTFFDEVRRITYLRGLKLPAFSEFRVADWDIKKNDDNKLMESIMDVLPRKGKIALSLSSGMDSRFILGLMRKVGIKPKAYVMKCDEDEVIKQIVTLLGLESEFNLFPYMNDYDYTLRSDARIFDRGGNYHRMIGNVDNNEFLFNGLSAEPALKNTYRAAWRMPDLFYKTAHDRIVENIYMSAVPKNIEALLIGRNELKDFIQSELEFMKNEVPQLKWTHHISRLYGHYDDLNWMSAHTADLSFLRYSISPLACKKVVEYGITSSLTGNIDFNRLKKLNEELMPDIRFDYSDDRTYTRRNLLIQLPYALFTELFEIGSYYKIRAQIMKVTSTRKNQDTYEAKCASDLHLYFDRPIVELVRSNVVKAMKRTAITVNNLLLFKEKYKAQLENN